MTLLLVLLVALLAFANGANDNSKGVATLVGYGAAQPRQALVWAMVTTALGAVVSFWFSGGLVKTFRTGLFAEGTPLHASFFVAVLVGAFGWLILATWTGLPVSTTHAITGALTGAGLVAFGSANLQWSSLGGRFALPLALSPLLSMSLVYCVAWPVVLIVARVKGWCVCMRKGLSISSAGTPGASAAVQAPELAIVVGREKECARSQPTIALTASGAANALHWASSGLVGFARGWNDAPKIVALSLVVLTGQGSMTVGFVVVTLAMAVGGLVAGRRVLDTLSRKVTVMPLAESLTANLTTAALVGLASWSGLPVSTTHVSTGAIVGAGLKNNPREVRWTKVGEIVLAWFVTLPVAGLLAATASWFLPSSQ